MNSQSKKTFKLVFLSTLLFVTTNNLFSENIERKEVAKIKGSPLQIYYKQNPWAFVAKKFIDEPEEEFKSSIRNVRRIGFFLLGGLIPALMGGAATEKDNHVFVGGFIGYLLGGSAGVYLYNCWLRKYLDYDCIRKFLLKYNPNLKDLDLKNNKFYLPKKLHNAFDALFEKNHKTESPFFKNNGIEILKGIRNDIKYNLNTKEG